MKFREIGRSELLIDAAVRKVHKRLDERQGEFFNNY